MGWLGRGGESLLTFLPTDEAARATASAALANALAGLVESGERRALLLATIDGEPAEKSALGASLLAARFSASREGWQRRRSPSALFPSRSDAFPDQAEPSHETTEPKGDGAEVDEEPRA